MIEDSLPQVAALKITRFTFVRLVYEEMFKLMNVKITHVLEGKCASYEIVYTQQRRTKEIYSIT